MRVCVCAGSSRVPLTLVLLFFFSSNQEAPSLYFLVSGLERSNCRQNGKFSKTHQRGVSLAPADVYLARWTRKWCAEGRRCPGRVHFSSFRAFPQTHLCAGCAAEKLRPPNRFASYVTWAIFLSTNQVVVGGFGPNRSFLKL